jgi:prepilin signal peptidase PulO-like enzyme (type II secretory pathway)
VILDNVFIYIIVFAGGTFAGSFFYTLALKYINGEIKANPLKALFSRSSCTCCGHRIGVFYMIPVLGYFLSAGKCRECNSAISPLYPAWEIIYGFLAVAVFYFSGSGLSALFIFFICSISLCIAVVDYYTFIVPDSLVIAFILFSIYPVFLRGEWLNNAAGFAFLAVFFIVVMLVFPGAFGGGDLKLFAAAGFFFGLEEAVVFLEVTLISGAAAGAVWALFKKKGLRVKIPFAPFITLGIIVTLFFGSHILLWYYSLVY